MDQRFVPIPDHHLKVDLDPASLRLLIAILQVGGKSKSIDRNELAKTLGWSLEQVDSSLDTLLDKNILQRRNSAEGAPPIAA